ncbi:Terpene cyclase/mutase family member, partial [Thalictrum thalictroides]
LQSASTLLNFESMRYACLRVGQNWDTGFALQALIASNLHAELWGTLKKGHDYMKQSQVKDNPSGDFPKHASSHFKRILDIF